MKFVVEIDPVAKERHRVDSYGHMFTPSATRAFENRLYFAIQKQLPAKPLTGPLKVSIRVYLCPPARFVRSSPFVKPDWDNFGKSICDALNSKFEKIQGKRLLVKKGLWEDDSQIVDGRVQKFYDWVTRKGRVEIEVDELVD